MVKYLLLLSVRPNQQVINEADQHNVLGHSEMIKSVPGDLIMIMYQRIEGTVLGRASF